MRIRFFWRRRMLPKFKTERLKQTLKECMKASEKALVSSSLDPRLILHRLAICSAS